MKNTYNRYRAQPKVTRTPEEKQPAARKASAESSRSSSSHRNYNPNETRPVESYKTQAAGGPDPRSARSYSSRSSSSSSNRVAVQKPVTREEAPARRSDYKAQPARQEHSSGSSYRASARPTESKARSIVAMALGIASIVIGWAYTYGAILGVAAGIVALCLQKADARAGVVSGEGFRKAAKICGIIGIVISGISLLVWILLTAGAFTLRSMMYDALSSYY